MRNLNDMANAILNELVACGFTEEEAIDLLQLISDGKLTELPF